MAKYLHRMTARWDMMGITVTRTQVEYTATNDEPEDVFWAGEAEVKMDRPEPALMKEAAALADELMDAIDSGDTEYIKQFWDISWERCIQKEDPRD